jgi:S1-C subfamily serine protease
MRNAILAATALIFSGSTYAQNQDDWIVLRHLAASVMQVQAMVNGRASYGSGVALTPHLVVTNCHVLGTPDAKLMRGVVSSAASLRVGDPRHDVCLLNVDAALASTPAIGQAAALKLGERVYALGFGMGRLTTSVGEVEALYPYWS